MLKFFEKDRAYVSTELMQAFILFLFLFPLFFQLSGSIFVTTGLNYDSQGKLLLLPLPIASVFCFMGIAFLLRLEKRHFGVGIVFSVFVLMMLSTIIITGNEGKLGLAKFILLLQFILPLFALVLGSLYIKPKSKFLRFEAVSLYILLIVIPLEVFSTIQIESGLLSPYLYIFSLYQHLQYLPVVFVGLYFLVITSFCEKSKLRFLVLFLSPWMGVYVAASLSILAIALTVIGFFTILLLLYKKNKIKYALLLVVLQLVSFAIYYPTVQETGTYRLKYDPDVQLAKEITLESKDNSFSNKIISILPNNLQARFYYWDFYGNGIFQSPKVFLFGHKSRPERNKYPSAHNYYLDLIYNFGAVSILPFVYLIFITMRNCWRGIMAGLLTPSTSMLMIVVGFFVFADNSLKVSFRQPYPGMVMFFLWGVLLTSLSKLEVNNRDRLS